jgi:ATP-dependent RNA helicase DDX51/DBP6
MALTILCSQVIDEADRLLAQSFQDWLAQVLAATRPPRTGASSLISDSTIPGPYSAVKSSIPYPDAVSPSFYHLISPPSPHYSEKPQSSCQKLLFSATLTTDPGKIAALELRDPKYFIVRETEEGIVDVATEKFSMPASLTVCLSSVFCIEEISDMLLSLRST